MIEMPKVPNSPYVKANDRKHITGSHKIKINSNGSEVLLLQFQSTALSSSPSREAYFYLPPINPLMHLKTPLFQQSPLQEIK